MWSLASSVGVLDSMGGYGRLYGCEIEYKGKLDINEVSLFWFVDHDENKGGEEEEEGEESKKE